ncbi:MAG: ABC transporter permease [Haloferacaceae archaeon]
MSRPDPGGARGRFRRVRAESTAAWHSFFRRRTAVFFTFLFPALLVLIFGALIETQSADGGLFAEPAEFYIAGYVATVVLFTPLSRVGSEVARHRENNRFEKLATTPLSRAEWLFAHTAVNVVVIGGASLLILAMVVGLTGAGLPRSPSVLLLIPFVAFTSALFCGVGAVLGRIADSRDGAIAASNGTAFPLLFLSEAFVSGEMFPAWILPILERSPVSYFARGVRAVTAAPTGSWLPELSVLLGLAVVSFAVGAYAIPRTD